MRRFIFKMPSHTYRRLSHAIRRKQFIGSNQYWETRYADGGNSGAGSRSHLAEFKADFLNNFVASHGIYNVIELGCGDGYQLGLARYPRYTGVDVSKTAVQICKKTFRDDETKTFLTSIPKGNKFDLSISLDVIYHLIEDDIFTTYLKELFSLSRRWVIIYASNLHQIEFVRKFGVRAPHVKHRQFTTSVEELAPEWRLVERVPNDFPFDPKNPAETSFADFYIYEKSLGAP